MHARLHIGVAEELRLPPMICRIFTAEDYPHRASVEDVVSQDKPASWNSRNRDSWQFPRSIYNGHARGFIPNGSKLFRVS